MAHKILLAATLCLVLQGCGAPGDGQSGRVAIGGASGTELAAAQVLRWGNAAEPQSLDPHKAEGVPESNIQRDLFEGLIEEAANGDLVPGSALSWEVADDGTRYTFSLRRAARWSNGAPVTAADWVYGFRRSLDPATGSRYTFILEPIVNAIPISRGSLPVDALGVETSILNQEWKVYLDARRQKIDTQVYRAGWIGDYNDANTFASLYLSTSELNDPGYANPRYDELVYLAAAEGVLASRAEYLQEAERILLADLPILPLYFYVTTRLVKPWVAGLEPNIMNHHHSKHLRILAH